MVVHPGEEELEEDEAETEEAQEEKEDTLPIVMESVLWKDMLQTLKILPQEMLLVDQ